MARVFQPNRPDEYIIRRGADLFIRVANGGVIRLSVRTDSIEILPINGVRLELCVVNGCAGVRFVAPTAERP